MSEVVTYRIAKAFGFAAAHRLVGLSAEHPCSRVHGHNYTVTLEFESPQTDAVGFVLDYRALDRFKHWLDDAFDHQDLNAVLDFNPSAERLAAFVHAAASQLFEPELRFGLLRLVAVRVSETDKTWAEFRVA